ncbi:TPA: FTR1 family iron permease [Pasteurella multocida]|uniref:FTR1 family iron permease n=1 Tax=Pasteurella multocida TaxID=747 RepID=UPI0002EFB8FF|nr:FTR1 family protein [Pasteurella multocida]AWW59413.1 iron permease [Pasteurellaceae bacterium 12591]AHE63920.1 high-affinity Fe2+/Pb2+ permease [Pasteurella multocida subsp. multocida str. HB03]AIN48590.1 iron permease FTR1 family protein [Pasteurella multocida]ANJ89693.1 membrane protein YwbL [Pasteurella multocida subsp. multocida HB01]AON57517.1 iron permease [Pasteurella multocida]
MFYVKQLRYLVLIFSVFFCAFTQAKDNYAEWIQDIEHRLDKTAHLYQQGQADEARTEVQMAYFEVFENLEGPIRINFSAQKSYQMEATFAEIRKMIGEGVSLEAIQTKINGLKSELQEVLPVLTDGHQLNASAQHDVYSNQTIAQHWQQSFKIIDDLLAQAISAYEQGEFAQAKKWVQQAQYDGFKNAEMEMAIRQNRSASISASINQQFYDLIRLSEKPDQLNNLGYQITLLLQEIEEQLPNLPTTRETQVVQAQVNSTDNTPDQDWQKVTNEINQRIQQAMNLYQQGEQKKAMLAVQDTYFDVFESSGMENKIGARDSNMKAELEGYFTRLVSLIKANASSDQLQQQANQLAQGLSKSVEMLQGGKQSHWSMFLYSLLIILREGLEALLIVAAIVTYLIKNQHQDKLPVIRQSVYVALIASLITAVIFQFVFANAGASRELLEGFTMMIAVVMLFMMSYWLLSKVEAQNWQRYLEGKLSSALTTGSLIGLWLTSFLAVYREGAETVLFYYALVADATSAVSYLYLFAGLVVGIVILTVCYLIMRYTVVKLPLKPFFMFTGTFMYLMAFVFAGKSVLELIEGKLFEPTLIVGAPEISWLGIYPYLETLIPQVILLIAALFALFYMKYQNRKAV